MRIFITSTPEELAPHQTAACEVARELGHEAVLRNPALGRGLKPVAACARQVARADLLLAIVGHRRGLVPPPELGGDGRHPWSWWETRAAFQRGKPVVALATVESWRPELREDDPQAHAVVRDFRGELARLAVPFDADDANGFRELVRRELARSSQATSSGAGEARLRRWPAPELPEHPYPVLLPYTHPDLMAGREHELARLRKLLESPVPITGLYAPSGTGKSSLLAGGLIPALRAEGRPVAFERHPCEPGIAARLLGDLLDDAKIDLADHARHAFVDRLVAVRRQAGVPSVLVLDQFEDLLAKDSERRARAVVGLLLASSVQRLPELEGPPCRWLLAYRQEAHGDVFEWLHDVASDIHLEELTVTESLPHDLSGPERFQAWPLPALGTPAPGTDDRTKAAAQVFEAAITKPLDICKENGEKRYPWRFVADGAARLARAFGEARMARRNAPLVPELQVVLAHLLEGSFPAPGEVVDVEVPDDPGELIDRALEEHLRRSLDVAFPSGRRATAVIGRTRALLALRELADAHGQRDEGRPVAVLARAIGQDGRDVLEKMATAQTRLVLLERSGDDQVYVLSHERMAEVVVRLVDDEGAYAGLGVDAELLGLRRFVALQRELFTSGEVEQATAVPKDHFHGIEEHTDALLWGDEGRRWWRACRERRRRDRWRKATRGGSVAVAVVLLIVVVWIWAGRIFERRELLKTIVSGEPEASFAALARLTAETDVDSADLLDRVGGREMPFDVLERGLGGVGEEERGPALLRVAELLLPLLQEEAPEDPAWIASMVWALDFFASPDPALREQAIALRDAVLGPLRRSRPPPSFPDLEDPAWAYIPAGTFRMGIGPGEERDEDPFEEWPRHQVTISAFRLMTHEVTTAEYRRLVAGHRGEDAPDLPVAYVSWYEAYTYAAWLGGRLPTEAEWEYAARAGCRYAYCKHDGSEATLSEVAWWPGNSVDTKTSEPARKPVRQLEENPWGLFDVYGNAWEWNADWVGPYSEEREFDPPGPTSPSSMESYRTMRGGCALMGAEYTVASRRGTFDVMARLPHIGLRVTLPTHEERPGNQGPYPRFPG